MTRRFFIETFGCQMNDLDSEKIAGSLQHEGMSPAASASEADLILLNTCSVREKAVQKVYARLGEIRHQKLQRSDLLVGVVGCMAQLEVQQLMRRAPFVSIVAGPQKSRLMPGLVRRAEAEGSPVVDLRMDKDEGETSDAPYVLRNSSWQAGVTISEGCSRACAFCVVPFTRGKERNRPAAAIVREIEELAGKNYVEVLLLGQTVNSYRDPDTGLSFAGLLRRISGIPGLARIRFTSPHPGDFTDELLEVMVSCPQVCNQIHLPVQSGSTAILRLMRRGYTRERYLETVRKIKAAPRPIAISTDLIVGFPGESEADFRDTLTLLDEVQFDSAFSFKYSPRPNTKALELPGEIPEEEKGRRLMILQEQQRIIQYNKNAAYPGRIADVLVEGRPKSRFSLAGRTTENKIVNFDGPDSLMGRIVPVLISGFSANSLKGIRVEEGQEGQ